MIDNVTNVTMILYNDFLCKKNRTRREIAVEKSLRFFPILFFFSELMTQALWAQYPTLPVKLILGEILKQKTQRSYTDQYIYIYINLNRYQYMYIYISYVNISPNTYYILYNYESKFALKYKSFLNKLEASETFTSHIWDFHFPHLRLSLPSFRMNWQLTQHGVEKPWTFIRVPTYANYLQHCEVFKTGIRCISWWPRFANTCVGF